MQKISYVNASDGLANASLMTVSTLRSPGATEILVNTVADVPAAGFFATMGTPHTFTDPVTGETIQIISEATAVDFYGHISSGKVEIDGISPGYSDTNGSKVGDIIVVKPTTDWANNLKNILNQAHNDDGSLKNGAVGTESVFATPLDPVTRDADSQYNYIASGCVWTADAAGSTLKASMTAGVVYVAGKRLTVALITAHTFTASKDTYVDFQDNGDSTAKVVFTEASNNVASPAIPNSLADATNARNAIIVSGSSSIAAAASINQGQEDRVLPISSSIPYAVTDSLGNLICPRDPQRKLLGYRQIISAFVHTSTGGIDITGLSVPFLAYGRKIKSNVKCSFVQNSSAAAYVATGVFESSTCIDAAFSTSSTANADSNLNMERVQTPSAGLHTYRVSSEITTGQATYNAGNTPNMGGSAAPMYIKIEQE